MGTDVVPHHQPLLGIHPRHQSPSSSHYSGEIPIRRNVEYLIPEWRPTHNCTFAHSRVASFFVSAWTHCAQRHIHISPIPTVPTPGSLSNATNRVMLAARNIAYFGEPFASNSTNDAMVSRSRADLVPRRKSQSSEMDHQVLLDRDPRRGGGI